METTGKKARRAISESNKGTSSFLQNLGENVPPMPPLVANTFLVSMDRFFIGIRYHPLPTKNELKYLRYAFMLHTRSTWYWHIVFFLTFFARSWWKFGSISQLSKGTRFTHYLTENNINKDVLKSFMLEKVRFIP